MMLLVSDPGLEALLRSPALLEQVWPGASKDVMFVITVLTSNAFPTLRDLLLVGLIGLMTPVAGALPGRLSLSWERVVFVAVGVGADARRVNKPHERTGDVECLRVVDVAVGGHSALKAAV